MSSSSWQSYHVAYVVTLLPALAITLIVGQANMFVTFISLFFVAFAGLRGPTR